MSKEPVRYQVNMEDIKSHLFDHKKFFRKPDFTRFRDPVYQRYVVRRAIIYSILTVFCVAYLLLLSASTSPLYKNYCDGDSSIFMFIGKAITLGKNVYTDYFDHKGPILFYLNALGYWLTDSKSGIFIIQCISLSLTSIFMYKTARIFTKTIRAFICVIVTILIFTATISDGNLSEEYCMLFCMIPIYLSVKFITKSPDAPHSAKYMLIYGICFGICAFIRINNGVMIGGIVLLTLVTDFANEHISAALKNILFFFIGIIIVSIPICLFFFVKGTLNDMLFSTFTFNFIYATKGSTENVNLISQLFQWVLPILILIFVTTIFSKRFGPKIASLITTISVFALIPAMMGFNYTHYYTTLIPLVLLYMSVFFFLVGDRVNILSILMCVIMVVPLSSYLTMIPSNISHYATKLYRQSNPTVYKDIASDISYSADEFSSMIPENDKDSVFGYNISAAWYLQADIMPCYRLFTLQESWSESYPEFGRQINQMMIDTPPKWVVIHNIDIIESRQFLRVLSDNYELESEFGYDLLYRYKH